VLKVLVPGIFYGTRTRVHFLKLICFRYSY